MFPGFRSSLIFSGFGLKPPASGLQFFFVFFYSSPRLLHLYSTNDKTSRLKMKIFSTVRFTELHGEEKREEGDRGDQEEKRGDQKRREQASQ